MIEDLDRVTALLERIDGKLGKTSAPTGGTVTSSNYNINGGGWINTLTLIFVGGLALSMFLLYLSDREAATRERDDFRQQARIDIQRLDKDLTDQGQKIETQQAYVNEIYRSLRKQ